MIFFVDIDRSFGHELRMYIHKLDASSGQHKVQHFRSHSVVDFGKVLHWTVMKERPKQVIFDKASFGIVVYDNFKKLVDKDEGVHMLDNGMLYYN